MKKIKQYLVHKIVSSTKNYNRIEKLHKKLTKLLAKHEFFQLEKYINDVIAKSNVSESTASIMRKAAMSALVATNNEIGIKVSKKTRLNIILNLFHHLSENIGKVVSIQPISAPVAQVFRLSYNTIEDEPKKLALELTSNIVEARVRKLLSFMTLPLDTSGFSEEISKELEKAIAFEMEEEITANIISDIIQSAKHENIDLSENFVTDKVDIIINKIAMECNSIAMDTKLGAGNVIIVSPIMATMLALSPNFKHDNSTLKIGTILYIGTLNNTIKVFSRIPSTPYDANIDQIVVGYNSGFNTGYIYAPYEIKLGGLTMDENLNPKHELFHRGSFNMFDKSYYRVIDIKGLY